MKPIAILGAGLTGLSAAYHLQDHYELFEQEATTGGLCRTMQRNGFWFDYTGHLLHLRQDYTKKLIQHLLPGHYTLLSRKAAIYMHNSYIPYPFQANIYHLATDVVKECILGFIDTLRHDRTDSAPDALSFQEWALSTFGTGIAKYFMLPYNQKLWRIPLDQLSADWVSWSIPKPTLEEFLNGALGIDNPDFGYNPTFLYPKTGGTEQLPQALLQHLQPERIHYKKRAIEVDAAQKVIHFADGSTSSYDTLISTMPLKHFIEIIRDVPDQVARAARQLRYISVYDLNIGVNRTNISDKHWIYFPEPEYPFYRVGFPANFSPNIAPEGCSSMYVEVSSLPQENISENTIRDQVYAGLKQCGILQENDEILVCDIVRIDCAYVIYDLHRTQALQAISSYLQEHSIYSTGRYGSWEYSAMEDAILAGKHVAEILHT